MEPINQKQADYIQEVLGVSGVLMPNISENVDSYGPKAKNGSTAIKVEGSFHSPLMLVAAGPLGAAGKVLFDRISAATKISDPLKVVIEAGAGKDKLAKVFGMFRGQKAVAFGEETFEMVGGDRNFFFDHFSKEIVLFNLNWVTTHSLLDMCEGQEQQVQNLKRQVWSQLKNIIKEL